MLPWVLLACHLLQNPPDAFPGGIFIVCWVLRQELHDPEKPDYNLYTSSSIGLLMHGQEKLCDDALPLFRMPIVCVDLHRRYHFGVLRQIREEMCIRAVLYQRHS